MNTPIKQDPSAPVQAFVQDLADLLWAYRGGQDQIANMQAAYAGQQTRFATTLSTINDKSKAVGQAIGQAQAGTGTLQAAADAWSALNNFLIQLTGAQ